MADAQGTPSSRARQLARELRLLREAERLHGKEVAKTMGWSASKLSRIENGRIGISERDLERLIELYRIPQQQAVSLRTLAPRIAAKGWWDAYSEAVPAGYASLLKLEADSLAVQCYCAVVPHALFQTADYSRMVILAGAREPSPKELERRLDIVRRRQGRWARRPAAGTRCASMPCWTRASSCGSSPRARRRAGPRCRPGSSSA